MKMLNNVREVDAFATSRIPTPSPLCTKMGEDDPRCAARLPEHPVQVRHRPHHAEDVAEAVVEPVDGVDAREKKDIKNNVLPRTDVKAPWPANANAPRLDVADLSNDVKRWRVEKHRSWWISKKALI